MHFPALTTRRMTGLLITAVCGAALIPAVALAATASSASPAAHATASAATIDTLSINSATLVANGAAVRVAFTATCGAGDDGGISSTITETVGVHLAQGSPGVGFKCTGKPQHLSALAAGNVNGAPFRLGIALVQAGLSDCPGANCTGASANKILLIVR